MSTEELSSSEDSMDCRESRNKQKGMGQDPKLEFGPRKLEVVREEEATKKAAGKKAAAKKAAGKKASAASGSAPSSSSTAPGTNTSLDKRELRRRCGERVSPWNFGQIAIDHHNVLEVNGHIYPRASGS
eukprot:s2780_g13.t1